tara:strand:- start:717 stop:995 length:279 start_codon:yes stop_codon:yes gene_type:complete
MIKHKYKLKNLILFITIIKYKYIILYLLLKKNNYKLINLYFTLLCKLKNNKELNNIDKLILFITSLISNNNFINFFQKSINFLKNINLLKIL